MARASSVGRRRRSTSEAIVRPIAQAHRPPPRRRRGVGVAASLAAHALAALLVLWAAPKPQPIYDPKPVEVQLIDLPPTPAPAPLRGPAPLPPAPAPPAPPSPKKAAAAPRKAPPRPAAAPRHLVAKASEAALAGSGAELSAAEEAGAAVAGSGGGGGSGGECNMAARVQAALRRDPLAKSAVARFAGRAIRLWDGDWVWIPGDDGRGVAAVRQAVMWEIAFAPAACKAQRMHGLVLLSANSARLAVGDGDWRWSDLLIPHPGMGGEHYTQ
jgi:hypothetical protein